MTQTAQEFSKARRSSLIAAIFILGVMVCLLSWYMAFMSAGAIFAYLNAA